MTCMMVLIVPSILCVDSGLVEFGDTYVWAVDGSVSVHSGGREKFPEWGVQVSLAWVNLHDSKDFLHTSLYTVNSHSV